MDLKVIYLILLLTTFHIVHCGHEHMKSVIKDFIKTSQQSVFVNGILCWNIDDIFNLHRQLRDTRMRVHSSTDPRVLSLLEMKFDHPKRQYELFVVDLACPNITDVFLKASDNNLFGFPYRWILLSEKIGASEILNLKNLKILPDSDVVIVEPQKENTEEMMLYQVYKTMVDQDLLMETYGTWSLSKGISDMRKSNIISRRRKDLHGTNLTISLVVTTINSSLKEFEEYRFHPVDSITLTTFKVVHHLLDIVNVSRTFSIIRTWGHRDKNNKWTDMLRELELGNADIGTPLFFNADRLEIIDYISMATPTQTRFIFRAPPLSYVSNIFAMPFSVGVWLCSLALVLIMAVGITIAVKWEWIDLPLDNTDKGKNSDVKASRLRPSWSEILIISLGAVCQQGPPKEPKNISGRVLMLFLFTAVMFLYTSYSANIVSLLQSSTTSIKTLSDLLNSRLKLGVEDMAYTRYYFSTAKDSIRKAIYTEKVATSGGKGGFMSTVEGMKKVRQGLFAFHMERGPAYKIISETFHENEKCGLVEIDFLTATDPWLPIRKRSPYKEILKVNLFKIRESGIQNREVLKIYTKKPECTAGQINFISVGYIECYFAILVLICGIGTATILLAIELLIKFKIKTNCIRISITN